MGRERIPELDAVRLELSYWGTEMHRSKIVGMGVGRCTLNIGGGGDGDLEVRNSFDPITEAYTDLEKHDSVEHHAIRLYYCNKIERMNDLGKKLGVSAKKASMKLISAEKYINGFWQGATRTSERVNG